MRRLGLARNLDAKWTLRSIRLVLLHDTHLNRDVALKVLPAGALADETARKRFRKEGGPACSFSGSSLASSQFAHRMAISSVIAAIISSNQSLYAPGSPLVLEFLYSEISSDRARLSRHTCQAGHSRSCICHPRRSRQSTGSRL